VWDAHTERAGFDQIKFAQAGLKVRPTPTRDKGGAGEERNLQFFGAPHHPERVGGTVAQVLITVHWACAPDLCKDAADLLKHVALGIECATVLVAWIIPMLSDQHHAVQVKAHCCRVGAAALKQRLSDGGEYRHAVISRQLHTDVVRHPAAGDGEASARLPLPVHAVECREVNLVQVHGHDLDSWGVEALVSRHTLEQLGDYHVRMALREIRGDDGRHARPTTLLLQPGIGRAAAGIGGARGDMPADRTETVHLHLRRKSQLAAVGCSGHSGALHVYWSPLLV